MSDLWNSDPKGSEVGTFLDLSDTPGSYAGQGGKAVAVNVGENALEFIAFPAGYTNEEAQDAVGGIFVDSSEINFTYDDATPSITASLVAGSIDETKLDTSVNASLDLADTALQNIVEDLTPELGGDLDANSKNITELGDITFKTGAQGGTVRTGTSAADKFTLQAYDVNSGVYRTLLEADAGNDVTLQAIADYWHFEDATDTTKRFDLSLSGATTGKTTTFSFAHTDNRTITIPDATGTLALTSDLSSYQLLSEKGNANGYASLDAGGKVPIGQLPSSIMEYQGVWNASTNTPTLIDGTGDNGDVYRVSVAGSQDLGSGSISFEVGDYVIYNGTIWEKSDTTDAVASVFGRTGNVVAASNDYTWAQINKATSSLADVTTRSHADLQNLTADDHTQYVLADGTRAITGAQTFNVGIVPDANDGAYLGTSTLSFSDLFLAAGGNINWNNGAATITESSGSIAYDAATHAFTSSANILFTSEPGSNAPIWNRQLSVDGNTVREVVQFRRTYSAGAGADGIGAKFGFYAETETEGVIESIGELGFQATDATAGTVDADFFVTSRINGAGTNTLTFTSTGQLRLPVGSSATPSIRLGTTTGFYRKTQGATDQVVAVANGADSAFMVQNLSSTGYSGVSYVDNNEVVAIFTGYNNNNGEFRFNNVTNLAGTGKTSTINFLLDNSSKLFIRASGLAIGGTAERATTAGTNHLDIFNGTAPTGTLSNGISIYSSSGEGYMMDAAGNASIQTPHDKEGNWIFKSTHTPTGRVLKVDMEKMMKFLNDYFGTDFVHEYFES